MLRLVVRVFQKKKQLTITEAELSVFPTCHLADIYCA